MLQQAYELAVAQSNRCFDAEDWLGAKLYHDVAESIGEALLHRPQPVPSKDLEPCGA